jgi:hypothetical protein
LILSSIRVTAPDPANSRPLTLTPLLTEIETAAIIVPLNFDPVLSVAELPTIAGIGLIDQLDFAADGRR